MKFSSHGNVRNSMQGRNLNRVFTLNYTRVSTPFRKTDGATSGFNTLNIFSRGKVKFEIIYNIYSQSKNNKKYSTSV